MSRPSRETPELFPPADSDALARESRAAYARIRPLLVERGRRGLIRRIHGDLHLGNIVLIDGRPVLFDAIEFSPLIASGDVLYDLAFLLMDLIERGLGAGRQYRAQPLSRSKPPRTEDLDALAALPFFLSMRAAIRAKVTAARLERPQPRTRAAIAASARKYFDWARRFIAPAPPLLVAVGGPVGHRQIGARARAGAGARASARRGGAALRRRAQGAVRRGTSTRSCRDDAYAPEVTARVYATIIDKARRVIGRRPFGDRRCGVRATGRARTSSSSPPPCSALPFTASSSTPTSRRASRASDRARRDASDADAAVARQQESYDLGAARLAARRCLGHAGRDPRARTSGDRHVMR